MTYQSASSNTPYEGNGSATSFPTGFTFLSNDQVKAVVRINGLDTDLVEDTDYTLTGAGEALGGTLVFPIEGSAHHTLASGERLVIYLDPPIVQDRAIGQSTVVDLPVIETALDQLTMICASLDEKVSRVPQYPPSSTTEEIGSPEDYLAEITAQRSGAEAAQAGAEAAQAGAEAAQAGAEAAQAGAEAAQAGAEAVLSSALHIDQNLADVGSVPAARANLDVYSQDDVDALLTRHSFAAGKSADQTGIASATWTKITYTAEEYDHGSVYDAANSRLTPGRAGVWLIGALVNFTAGIVDQSAYQCAIYKNGAPYRASYSRASGTNSLSAALVCTVEVDADDYIEIYAYGAGDRKSVV
jgi:hypothetical protein